MSVRKLYGKQRRNAKRRGIAWDFTFEDWVRWWETELGPEWISKRGKGKGKYCMSRLKDKGPYITWNVRCILYEVNSIDGMVGRRRSEVAKIKTSLSLIGRPLTRSVFKLGNIPWNKGMHR